MNTQRQDPGYEQRDVSPRLPLATAVLVLCLLPLVLALIAGAFALRGDTAFSPRVSEFFDLSLQDDDTQPSLQAEPHSDLRRMRQVSNRGLHDYAWLDREAGVVRLPIERAMSLYVRRHGDDGEAAP